MPLEMGVGWTGHFLVAGAARQYQPLSGLASLDFAMRAAGAAPPKMARCCQIGGGAAISSIINAACNPAVDVVGLRGNGDDEWCGLADGLSLPNLRLVRAEEDLFELASTGPGFDLIAMLGEWSFLESAARSTEMQRMADMLDPAGVLCLEASALPGQSAALAMHRLVRTYLDAGEGLDDVLRHALRFLDLNPKAVGQAWGDRTPVEAYLGQARSEISDGARVGAWAPSWFHELDEVARAAGLEWCCRVRPLESVDALHLTAPQREQLAAVSDRTMREQLRDFFMNTRLRADLWRRQPQDRAGARTGLLEDRSVVLVVPSGEVPREVFGGLGKVSLSRAVHGPLLEALAGHRAVSVKEIHARVSEHFSWDDLCDALAILHGLGAIAVIRPAEGRAGAPTSNVQAVNRGLLAAAREGRETTHLASALVGEGIAVSWEHQLFLAARLQGEQRAQDWARFAQSCAQRQGRGEAALSGISDRAARFEQAYSPIYQALEIIH